MGAKNHIEINDKHSEDGICSCQVKSYNSLFHFFIFYETNVEMKNRGKFDLSQIIHLNFGPDPA